jgi:hypothetical protein
VLAISEKVVLRVEDLITWITVDAEWTWGRLAKCESDVKDPPKSEDNKNIVGSLTESSLDFSDVEKERKTSGEWLKQSLLFDEEAEFLVLRHLNHLNLFEQFVLQY